MEKSTELIKREYSSVLLAYLGDAYYETLAREYVIEGGDCKLSDVNKKILDLVTAVSQSKIVEIILPHLTEEEEWFYKSGRNAHNTHRTRSAAAVEYRRATGLECLFGFYFLSGRETRARELFGLITSGVYNDGGNNHD